MSQAKLLIILQEVPLLADEFGILGGSNPQAMALKHELSQVILWTEHNAPRSLQRSIGPSELGDACDRRLAYRIAGIEPVNFGDPWPAIVGTSIHDWLERAINRYQSTVKDLGYLTELRVYPDPMVKGRSDLFHVPTATVVDHKAQPLDEPILTPAGWVRMGDLTVGDLVIGSDGRPTKVQGIFPQGFSQVYRVHTSDHAWTEVTGDHLWEVRCRDAVRRSRIMTTLEIAAELTKSRPQYQVLPQLRPVVFDPVDLPLDPYALGLLLGDGGMSRDSVRFSNADGLEAHLPFQVSRIKVGPGKCPTFTVLGAVPVMRELGLMGHLSIDKFIPEIYLRASVADRLALLQGIMDTDGGLQKRRACLVTSSDLMAEGFVELVQSLGGKCFVHKDKKLRSGATRLAYLIHFKLPEDMNPFRADLENKKLQWVRGRDTHERFIKAVEPGRITEVQCIKVEADDGLYVTRGYLLTHNTTGTDGMRKIRKGIIPEGYRTQVQVYGLGHRRAGRDVKHVALIFYPRSGWLDDAYVWVEPYDEQVAVAALRRLYRIAYELLDHDIENNPHRFQLVEPTPGDSCVWCPFYLRESDVDTPASERGCPGR